MKILALFELLEHLSFPFLSAMNIKSEINNTICVEYQNLLGNTAEQFIQKQIEQNKEIDEQKLLDYASQGALTLAFLHKHKIVHGQISPQNLSIAEDGTLKFERRIETKCKSIIGLCRYIRKSYLAQLLVDITGASVQDRLAIVERGEFIELVNILKWAHKQNKELSRPIQLWVCEVVQDLINENKQAAIKGFEQFEIIQQLKELLGSDLELEEVKFVHANALKLFTTYANSDKNKKLMHDIGLAQAVTQNIKSQCSGVSEKSVMTITNQLIFQVDIYRNLGQHPYLEQFSKDGIISALFNDGLINGKSERTKVTSAYGLGWVYRATPLPEEMKSVIINQLK
ncbi:MAG: hypothetical protein EZS28_010651 [Streblomastix strix]|uniref:Protein kinase domain-containing protein n=1 Tax=Streblomastix strix TaxID=222440 RepID=A0A5J4WFQ8_9EUKA|nr:MAG: hypothetical protein EZS28_010651 [Streblomastix strix]